MKRLTSIIMLLLIFGLLAACTDQPREEPQIEAVYDSVMYKLDLPESFPYELAGNGRNTVMLPFSNNGENGDANVHGGTAIYRMNIEGDTAKGTLVRELEKPAELLGMDGNDGIWLYDGSLRRIDLDGTETLAIELPYPLWQNGVFGFADDGDYTYFLCCFKNPDESQILVYDKTGDLVFSQELTEYCQDTAGFIPQEEEWAEDLEGREDDFLMSLLFAEGPIDSVRLSQGRNGSPVVTIIRKSPIDGERYCILCPIQEDFSIVPVMYYEVENESGIPYGVPMASPEDQYDLLSPQKDALYGISLDAGKLTALAGWTQLQSNASWFDGWANSVGMGPDGRIWSLEYSKEEDGYVVRSIGPKAAEYHADRPV